MEGPQLRVAARHDAPPRAVRGLAFREEMGPLPLASPDHGPVALEHAQVVVEDARRETGLPHEFAERDARILEDGGCQLVPPRVLHLAAAVPPRISFTARRGEDSLVGPVRLSSSPFWTGLVVGPSSARRTRDVMPALRTSLTLLAAALLLLPAAISQVPSVADDGDRDGSTFQAEAIGASNPWQPASTPTTDDDGDGRINANENRVQGAAWHICSGSLGVVATTGCQGYRNPSGYSVTQSAGGVTWADAWRDNDGRVWVWDAVCLPAAEGGYDQCKDGNRDLATTHYSGGFTTDGYGWRRIDVAQGVTIEALGICADGVHDSDADGIPTIELCVAALTFTSGGVSEGEPEPWKTIGDLDSRPLIAAPPPGPIPVLPATDGLGYIVLPLGSEPEVHDAPVPDAAGNLRLLFMVIGAGGNASGTLRAYDLFGTIVYSQTSPIHTEEGAEDTGLVYFEAIPSEGVARLQFEYGGQGTMVGTGDLPEVPDVDPESVCEEQSLGECLDPDCDAGIPGQCGPAPCETGCAPCDLYPVPYHCTALDPCDNVLYASVPGQCGTPPMDACAVDQALVHIDRCGSDPCTYVIPGSLPEQCGNPKLCADGTCDPCTISDLTCPNPCTVDECIEEVCDEECQQLVHTCDNGGCEPNDPCNDIDCEPSDPCQDLDCEDWLNLPQCERPKCIELTTPMRSAGGSNPRSCDGIHAATRYQGEEKGDSQTDQNGNFTPKLMTYVDVLWGTRWDYQFPCFPERQGFATYGMGVQWTGPNFFVPRAETIMHVNLEYRGASMYCYDSPVKTEHYACSPYSSVSLWIRPSSVAFVPPTDDGPSLVFLDVGNVTLNQQRQESKFCYPPSQALSFAFDVAVAVVGTAVSVASGPAVGLVAAGIGVSLIPFSQHLHKKACDFHRYRELPLVVEGQNVGNGIEVGPKYDGGVSFKQPILLQARVVVKAIRCEAEPVTFATWTTAEWGAHAEDPGSGEHASTKRVMEGTSTYRELDMYCIRR